MKRKKYSKWLALVLTSSMAFTMPAAAFAEDDEFATEIAAENVSEEESSLFSSEVTSDSQSNIEPDTATDQEDSSDSDVIEADNSSEDNDSTDNETESDNETDLELSEDTDKGTDSDNEITDATDNGDEAFSDGTDASDEFNDGEENSEEGTISDYTTFLSALKTLESYANDYVIENPTESSVALLINFIRTGVERYSSDAWGVMAGTENTAFTAYVKEKDTANNTDASALKNIETFTVPNGNTMDFGHVFGTMDIAWYAKTSGVDSTVELARTDMGGWAGDICDLLDYAKSVSGDDVDSMADTIRADYLGKSPAAGVENSFSQTDIYGDLDAFYILDTLSNGSQSLSSVIEGYYTVSLTDQSRALYFLTNRFGSVSSKEDIRNAVLTAYTGNTLISSLETSRGISGSEYDMQRTASCYAFADYLYTQLDNTEPENTYYTVFSNNSATLAPGIQQDITYALTADNKQIVFYTATIDTTRDDVSIYANYHNNDASSWAMSRVSDQMAAAQKKHSDSADTENYIENYNAVVGINADFYDMSSGAPQGALVMEGVEYHGVASENFFAILKDGTPVIGSPSDYATYKDQIQEAVGGSIFLIKDGKIAVSTSSDYYNNRASRTCVGITADGKVIMMVLDGRQEPFSAGGSAEEVAQIMLEAGCVTAINLDGGGSTTFDAKQEGSDEVSVVNRPSDGYERSVSSSLLVVSTAKTSNSFDHALISADYDYLTAGTNIKLTASGVSESGNAADIPDGTVWEVSDESVGTITNEGVFTAVSKGSTEVRLVLDGTVIGTKTLNVVFPDTLQFTKDNLNVVYGEAVELPLTASYSGNSVKINSSDIEFVLSNTNAGTVSDFTFTGNETAGVRNVKVTARLAKDYSVSASIQLALYTTDQAVFDFDNAMFGDRKLAWNRTVSNSTTTDNSVYYIVNAGEDMVASYTFALDMQKVEIPEQLNSLVKMIAGGDLESATAWNFLLQLAERVGTQTEVAVKLQFNSDVSIDYSQLKVVNDYFELTGTDFDTETNTLTIKINWIDQTQAIDAETANPIVILSGITVTPTNEASWNSDNCLMVNGSGSLTYDIYLRSSTLYSMSSQTSFQEQYGVYPYVNPDDSTEKGGHFSSEFRTFTDTYTLNDSIKGGWSEVNGKVYYFVDNEPLTGIQKLPGYEDEDNSYYYDLGEDGVYTGKLTGLFELDGAKYYAINGVLQSGWRVITGSSGEDNYYYFDYSTKKALDGEQRIGGYEYTFENCILTKGAWIKNEEGIRYVWAGHMMQNEWFTVDGKQYFAYANTHLLATGIRKTLNHERTGEEVYVFDENGVWLENLNGFYDYEDATYYVKNGIRVQYPGLILVDGNYYYFNSSNTMVKGKDYYISKTNGLKSAGTYTFDADGKLVEKELLNGIVKEEDGTWYYYVDGVKTYAGLIQIDADYYYVNSSFKVIHGQNYFISKTNGLKSRGTYSFDADGKMVLPDQSLDGIVKESDDIWYYYVKGVKTYAGMIQIDGDYYYVNSSFQVIHNRSYTISKTNGLMAQGTYYFGADGKMVKPDEAKNGIVKESDDIWYYYVNGVKTYAGLIQIDGDYYYVNSSFKVIHGQKYFISKTNGFMPNATYEFDSDGKMITE